MTDPLKSFTALANAKHKAVVADAAAKAMAEHCDERIAAANATIKALASELERVTHERNYAQRECEACAETAKNCLAGHKALVEALKAARDYIDERTIPRTEREALFTQIDAALKLAGEK